MFIAFGGAGSPVVAVCSTGVHAKPICIFPGVFVFFALISISFYTTGSEWFS